MKVINILGGIKDGGMMLSRKDLTVQFQTLAREHLFLKLQYSTLVQSVRIMLHF